MITNVEEQSGPKLPQPSESPGLNGNLMRTCWPRAAPPPCSCQEEVLIHVMCFLSLGRETTADPVECKSHGEKRPMKDGSRLGF